MADIVLPDSQSHSGSTISRAAAMACMVLIDAVS
jgi:hypothetical protein